MIGRNMKVPALAALVLLAAVSCGPSEAEIATSMEAAYRKGFYDGARRAVSEIEKAGTSFRDGLREKVGGRLIIFSVAAVLLTLFGAGLADWLRVRISRTFHLGLAQQEALAKSAYVIAAGAMVLAGMSAGTQALLPIGILLFGSLFPFREYISALRAGDRTGMKIAITKVKSLLFLSLVVVVIYRVLGDGGVFGLKIAK